MIDPVIHPPARLQIMTLLTAVSETEFATLRDSVGVSDSVMSKHLSALAEPGYIASHKGTHQGRRTTCVKLTTRGRRALTTHIEALQALIDSVETA